MSFDNPFGGDFGGFMSGMFADVLKMMRTQDPSHIDLITQLALSINGDPSEANVDPKDRILTEELSRVAELHVADVTGMSVLPSGRPLTVRALGKTAWTNYSIQCWRKTLEAIVTAHNAGSAMPSNSIELEDQGDQEDLAKMMQGWLGLIAPTISAMQIGSIIGHVATRALGQHDLLLPGEFGDGPAAIPRNRRQFAEDWSLPENDVTLWAATNDICTHAVLSRPHVSNRLRELIVAHAGNLHVDPNALQEQLGALGTGMPSDMSELAGLFNDPSSLLGATDSDEMRWQRLQLETLVTVIRGYADWVTRMVASRAIGAGSAIAEAMARARMERSDYERAADALFGFEQSSALYERGRSFVQGIIDRNGEHDLARLWVDEQNLPTPAELDAPGLWLERVNLD